MLRLQKLKSEKSGERIDFKLSNLQTLQVPKGWDRLFITVISVDQGKTLAKSAKASARNGSCRWTETVSESIWISQLDASNQNGECLLKLVVAMGLTRSGVLGEATINLAYYRSSKTAVPISVPLKKCNHGTILQFKIQCLSPGAEFREEQNECAEDMSVDDDDIENQSDVSDSVFTRSAGSSSSNHLEGTRDLSFSESGSHRYSFESTEGSLGRDRSSYAFNDSSRSNRSSFNSKISDHRSQLHNQREGYNQVPPAFSSSQLRNADSSKDLEDEGFMIEELQDEARQWEQNARRLMADVDDLQKELLDQSKQQTSLEKQLAESNKECDDVKLEVERLQILLTESMEKQTFSENLKYQNRKMDDVQEELEDEIKFQKESNASLALQLKKTQESNVELVSILQELEDTVEKQKIEIAGLLEVQSRGKNGSITEHGSVDLTTGFESDNDRNLKQEVLRLQESRKELVSTVQLLEKSLEEKVSEVETERSARAQFLKECESQWRDKLAAKEAEIINLEAKLQNAHGVKSRGDYSLSNEIEALKQKIEGLERDCSELTDENLELILKLKESEKGVQTNSFSSTSFSDEYQQNGSFSVLESQVKKMKSQIGKLEDDLNKKEILLQKISADDKEKISSYEKELATYRDRAEEDKMEIASLHEHLEEHKMETASLQEQLEERKKEIDALHEQLHNHKLEFSVLQEQLEKRVTEISALQEQSENYEMEISELQERLECTKEKEPEAKDQLRVAESHTCEMNRTLSELHVQVESCLANIKRQQNCTPCSPEELEEPNACNESQPENSTSFLSQNEQAKATLHDFLQLKHFLEVKLSESKDEIKLGQLHGVRDIDEDQNASEANLSTSGLEKESQEIGSTPEVSDSGKQQLLGKTGEVDNSGSNNLVELEDRASSQYQQELKTQIFDLQNQKQRLEEHVEMMRRESMATSKCLDDLRNEMTVLNSSMDSQASANKILEKKSSELESGKHELLVHLSELEKENIQLSERISAMEAQLRYLTDEKEASRAGLQNSESRAMNLKEEIKILEMKLETQKADMKQKLQDMQKKWLEAQEQNEYLKITSSKLQSTTENLIEESSMLQKSNAELRKQKTELHERCAVLEAELRESENTYSNLKNEAEALEEKYSSMQEEIASKEKAIKLEINALLHENQKLKVELESEVNRINEFCLENSSAVVNAERGTVNQLSMTNTENESTAPQELLEVSHLRVDKARLEVSLQELRERLKSSETNLSALQMETETKLEGLRDELAASNQKQEFFMADREKLLELLEEVKSNEEKHKTVIRGLELKLKASEYERTQVTEEISSLKVELQNTEPLQNEILALQSSLNAVKVENQRLEASIQMLSGDYEELKVDKMLALQKITELQQTVSELEDCRRSKVALEEKVLRLEGDLLAKEALGNQEAELKIELARVRRANAEFQRKIKNIDKERQDCERRAQASEEELKQLKEAKQNQQDIVVAGSDESTLSELNTKQNHTTTTSPSEGMESTAKIQCLENELAEALEANEMYKSQLKSLLSQSEGMLSLEVELKDLQERYLNMSLKYAEVEDERERILLKLRAGSSS